VPKNLVEINGDKSIQIFLLIIFFKDANFAIIYIIIYERKELLDMYKLVKTFRREYKL